MLCCRIFYSHCWFQQCSRNGFRGISCTQNEARSMPWYGLCWKSDGRLHHLLLPCISNHPLFGTLLSIDIPSTILQLHERLFQYLPMYTETTPCAATHHGHMKGWQKLTKKSCKALLTMSNWQQTLTWKYVGQIIWPTSLCHIGIIALLSVGKQNILMVAFGSQIAKSFNSIDVNTGDVIVVTICVIPCMLSKVKYSGLYYKAHSIEIYGC